MEPDKNNPTAPEDAANTPPATEGQSSADSQQVPADALSRTPEELEEEQAAQEAANPGAATAAVPEKKVSPIKRFFRRFNVYFLIFLLLVVIGSIIAIVSYLNSQKEPPEVTLANQGLTEETLKQLRNTDATVGNASQTLTIQGSAIIDGQTLMRGNLNVAGNIQSGGSMQAPSITISGAANLGEAQINSLQVASNTAVQGTTTLRDLNVAGTSSFSGAMTASQITATRLILSGNAVLQIPNHLSFTGPTPGRTVNHVVLGNGGSLSISGSDTSGTISINTGNNPTPGCFAQINFAQAFSAQPRVNVTPIGVAAGQTNFYVNRNNTSFSICTANAAPANQGFAFDYFVAG